MNEGKTTGIFALIAVVSLALAWWTNPESASDQSEMIDELVQTDVFKKFTDPADPDFQAPPTIASSFQPKKRYPEGFPTFKGLGMDAGKAVAPDKPMRAGVPITAHTHMHDIYTKTGRSGRMVFFVNRMEFSDADGTLLGSADTSIVIREKPQD